MDLIKKAIIDFTIAFRYFRNIGYWPYLIITACIGFVLGFIFMYIAYKTGAYMADWFSDLYPFEFGKKAAFTFFHLVPITYILAIMVVKYVIYIAVSPMMSRLSRKIVLQHSPNVGNDKSPSSWNLFVRTIKVSLRSIYKEILWTILFSIIGIIVPVIGFAGIFITQAYYIGYAHLDYTKARSLSFGEMNKWMKNNRGLALGNGIGYFTLFLIPIIGFFVAPVLSTAAATLSAKDDINVS